MNKYSVVLTFDDSWRRRYEVEAENETSAVSMAMELAEGENLGRLVLRAEVQKL